MRFSLPRTPLPQITQSIILADEGQQWNDPGVDSSVDPCVNDPGVDPSVDPCVNDPGVDPGVNDPGAAMGKRNRTNVPDQAKAMAEKHVFMAVEKNANFTIFQDGITGNLFVR